MTFPSFRLLCGALLLGAFFLNASAQTIAGSIKTVRITNNVQVLSADGSKHALKNGDTVTEGDSVITGVDSGVVLVFMNGSTVKVGADTRISIDEFKMDPFGENIVVGKLDKGEPSVSHTTLNVSYGEIVGNVKKLSKSSSYKINTPVGAAGIRGTVFRIKISRTADGNFRFILDTSEGLVDFTVTGGPGATSVPQDKELVIDFAVNTNTNQLGAFQISGLTGLSADATSALMAAAQTGLQQLINETVFPAFFTQAQKTADAQQFTTELPVVPDVISKSGPQ